MESHLRHGLLEVTVDTPHEEGARVSERLSQVHCVPQHFDQVLHVAILVFAALKEIQDLVHLVTREPELVDHAEKLLFRTLSHPGVTRQGLLARQLLQAPPVLQLAEQTYDLLEKFGLETIGV